MLIFSGGGPGRGGGGGEGACRPDYKLASGTHQTSLDTPPADCTLTVLEKIQKPRHGSYCTSDEKKTTIIADELARGDEESRSKDGVSSPSLLTSLRGGKCLCTEVMHSDVYYLQFIGMFYFVNNFEDYM